MFMLVQVNNLQPQRRFTMTQYKRILLPVITSAALFFGQFAYADMTLDADNSSLSFVSVKKGTAAEAHTIKNISGSLTFSW